MFDEFLNEDIDDDDDVPIFDELSHEEFDDGSVLQTSSDLRDPIYDKFEDKFHNDEGLSLSINESFLISREDMSKYWRQ